MALVTEWRLEFLQLHQLDSNLFFIRPMTNCGTFYCNISISPRYFYRSAILFCKLILLFQERQMDLVEVLGFIFMLSTMELGRVIIFSTSSTNVNLMATRQEYSTENLSGTQKAMLEDLRDYGLIWQRKV